MITGKFELESTAVESQRNLCLVMSSTRRDFGLDYRRSSGITRGTVNEKGSSARVTGAIHHVQEDYLWQERGRYARVRSPPRLYAHVNTHTHVHEIDTWVCAWCFESPRPESKSWQNPLASAVFLSQDAHSLQIFCELCGIYRHDSLGGFTWHDRL